MHIFATGASLPCCLFYHFPFKGRRWPESFWTHSSNWFLGPVEPRIVIYLHLWMLSRSSSSTLFYQDRWMCCVFILHFPSFSASHPVLSSRGIWFIVWKRIRRAHLASNQCLMATLGEGIPDLSHCISGWQNGLESAQLTGCVFWFTRRKLSHTDMLIPCCPTWINTDIFI